MWLRTAWREVTGALKQKNHHAEQVPSPKTPRGRCGVLGMKDPYILASHRLRIWKEEPLTKCWSRQKAKFWEAGDGNEGGVAPRVMDGGLPWQRHPCSWLSSRTQPWFGAECPNVKGSVASVKVAICRTREQFADASPHTCGGLEQKERRFARQRDGIENGGWVTLCTRPERQTTCMTLHACNLRRSWTCSRRLTPNIQMVCPKGVCKTPRTMLLLRYRYQWTIAWQLTR